MRAYSKIAFIFLILVIPNLFSKYLLDKKNIKWTRVTDIIIPINVALKEKFLYPK